MSVTADQFHHRWRDYSPILRRSTEGYWEYKLREHNLKRLISWKAFVKYIFFKFQQTKFVEVSRKIETKIT